MRWLSFRAVPELTHRTNAVLLGVLRVHNPLQLEAIIDWHIGSPRLRHRQTADHQCCGTSPSRMDHHPAILWV